MVVAVDVDEAYMDEKDTFHLSMAKPLAYSHGRYYGMGEELGSFRIQREKGGEKEDSDRKDRRKTGWKKSAGNRKEGCGKRTADAQESRK